MILSTLHECSYFSLLNFRSKKEKNNNSAIQLGLVSKFRENIILSSFSLLYLLRTNLPNRKFHTDLNVFKLFFFHIGRSSKLIYLVPLNFPCDGKLSIVSFITPQKNNGSVFVDGAFAWIVGRAVNNESPAINYKKYTMSTDLI